MAKPKPLTLAELGELARNAFNQPMHMGYKDRWQAAAAAILERLAQAGDARAWEDCYNDNGVRWGADAASPNSHELRAIAAEAGEVGD